MNEQLNTLANFIQEEWKPTHKLSLQSYQIDTCSDHLLTDEELKLIAQNLIGKVQADGREIVAFTSSIEIEKDQGRSNNNEVIVSSHSAQNLVRFRIDVFCIERR